MAGYGVRWGKKYDSIHDSIFVRTIVLQSGSTKVAMVSADLLILPPTVTEKLAKKLPAIGFNLGQMYFGAIHSHHSIGGWGERLAGEVFAGKFDEAIVDQIVEAILASVKAAEANLAPAQSGFSQIALPDRVHNRLTDEGTIDPFIRLLEFKKNTGETALLCTYSAHATTIEPDKLVLSRDWPGALVDSLERQKSVQFVQYMAGAVASMAPLEKGKDDWEELRTEAQGLEDSIQYELPTIQVHQDSTLRLIKLPLTLREPQWRLIGNLKMRYWLWKLVYGDYPSELSALRIGNTVFLGTPCDFSGEMVADFATLAQQHHINLVITSFNGGYIGYVTPDKYYEREAYESYTMNWFSPGTGSYLEELMRGLLELIS